jgi:sporulation protein YlmC with PRC-barrel domain
VDKNLLLVFLPSLIVLIIAIIGLIILLRLVKLLQKIEKSESVKNLIIKLRTPGALLENKTKILLQKIRKPKKINGAVSLASLLDKPLFDSRGYKLGVVEQPILEGNRVYGWQVKLDKNMGIWKNILIRQEHIQASKDIFIVDEKIADFVLGKNKP